MAVVPCHALPCCAMLCHAVPCCAMLCHAVPCCAMLCHAVLCCAMLRQAMPCYAMQDYVRALECCLARLQSQPDPQVSQRMQQLVFEAMRLRGQFLRLNTCKPRDSQQAQHAKQAQHAQAAQHTELDHDAAQPAVQNGYNHSSVPANLLVSIY